MADDKIKISWDEVNSPQIDARVHQQNLMGRAQEHYQQQATNVSPPGAPLREGSTSIWYNTLFYMTIFGLLGGSVAWLLGEVVTAFEPKALDEVKTFYGIVRAVERDVANGSLSEDAGNQIIHQAIEERKNNYFFSTVTDDRISDAEKQQRREGFLKSEGFKYQLAQAFWFATLGMALAFFLAIGDPIISRNGRGVLVNGSVGLLLGLLGGILVSLFINQLYGALMGGAESPLGIRSLFARAVGWGVLGMFLAVAPGVVLKNWKRFGIGIVGGLLGGLLGGALFNPVAELAHSAAISRGIAIVAIGVVAGAATGLIENAAKSGWLRVVAGLIAGKQFIVYRNPTYIGSSPQCEIYLFKDPRVAPRHAALHILPNGYEIEDLHSATGILVNGRPVSRARLRNNDQVQIGATAFQFQEKERPRA